MGLFIDTFQAIKALVDAVSAKLGANSDLWGGSTKTSLAFSNSVYKHIHNPSYVLPADCTFLEATAHATANTYGTPVTIAASTAAELDIHWVNIYEITQVANYILQICTLDGEGDPDIELGEVSLARSDTFSKSAQVYVQIPVVAASSHLAARVKSNTTNEGVVKFAVTYHDYT